MAVWAFSPEQGFNYADMGAYLGSDIPPQIPTVFPASVEGIEWWLTVPDGNGRPLSAGSITSYLFRNPDGSVGSGQNPGAPPPNPRFYVIVYNATFTNFLPDFTPESVTPPAYAAGGTAPNPGAAPADPDVTEWMQGPDYNADASRRWFWNAAQSTFAPFGDWPAQPSAVLSGAGHVVQEVAENVLSSSVTSDATAEGNRRAQGHTGLLWAVMTGGSTVEPPMDQWPADAIAVEYQANSGTVVGSTFSATMNAAGTGVRALRPATFPIAPDFTWDTAAKLQAMPLLARVLPGGAPVSFVDTLTYSDAQATKYLLYVAAVDNLYDGTVWPTTADWHGYLAGSLQVVRRPPMHRFRLGKKPLRMRQRTDGLGIAAPRTFSRERLSKQLSIRSGWRGTHL